MQSIHFEEIFTTQNIIIYFIAINLFGFFIMWLDKRKAKKGKWRIKEATLLVLALVGGSIGATIGMYMFHHKTKKARFFIGIPVMIFLQILIIIVILIK